VLVAERVGETLDGRRTRDGVPGDVERPVDLRERQRPSRADERSE